MCIHCYVFGVHRHLCLGYVYCLFIQYILDLQVFVWSATISVGLKNLPHVVYSHWSDTGPKVSIVKSFAQHCPSPTSQRYVFFYIGYLQPSTYKDCGGLHSRPLYWSRQFSLGIRQTAQAESIPRQLLGTSLQTGIVILPALPLDSAGSPASNIKGILWMVTASGLYTIAIVCVQHLLWSWPVLTWIRFSTKNSLVVD